MEECLGLPSREARIQSCPSSGSHEGLIVGQADFRLALIRGRENANPS